jgi:putative acetyltransferase
LPVERKGRASSTRSRLVAIRPLRTADLDTIGAIQEASILALGAGTYAPRQLAAWARLGWHFRHQLLRDPGDFMVALRAGRAVGVGGWSPDSLAADLAWLRYLFVHPDHAGLGIGRSLVGAAEAAARARRKSAFQVWSSLNAAGFYEACGYRRVRQGRWPLTGEIEIDFVLLAKQA